MAYSNTSNSNRKSDSSDFNHQDIYCFLNQQSFNSSVFSLSTYPVSIALYFLSSYRRSQDSYCSSRHLFLFSLYWICYILLLFHVLAFWPQGMWDFSSLTRDWACTPWIGRQNLNHWTAREGPSASLCYSRKGLRTKGLSPLEVLFCYPRREDPKLFIPRLFFTFHWP